MLNRGEKYLESEWRGSEEGGGRARIEIQGAATRYRPISTWLSAIRLERSGEATCLHSEATNSISDEECAGRSKKGQ